MELLPDGCLLIDEQGRVAEANSGALALFGCAPEEILSKSIENLIVNLQRPVAEDWAAFNSGHRPVWQFAGCSKAGGRFPVDVSARHLSLDGRGFICLLLRPLEAVADNSISQQKPFQQAQEHEIKTTNQALEQRIHELESFSYSVSHDLRAPLRAIEGFIGIFLARHQQQTDDDGRRLLAHVKSNVEKMNCLIDELLTLSRIGTKDIEIGPIDMRLLTLAVVEELGQGGEKARITVKELPGALGDVALIRQVLANLISNALKYSRNVKEPRIEVGFLNDDGLHCYYVKDNGAGFDMEHAEKMFGVFQRLHDSSEYEGAGVGLAIVQRIVNRHGGRVWAEGKEGEGATFFFTLKTTAA